METRNIPISKLAANNGQVDGLPKNPRQIKDKRFKALKKSIEDAPEMLNLRELIVYPHGGKFVAVCGNMRLRACRELGYKELPCKVLDEETPPEKLREYAIKDNVPFGEDDMDAFANEWDMAELEDWGMELNITETQKLSKAEYSGVFYEPKEIPNIRLSQCVDTRKFPSAVWAEKQRKNGGRIHHHIANKYLMPRVMRSVSGRDNIAWDTYPEDVPFTNEPNRL